MWEKWKQSKLCRKLKQVRVNRAVYLSSIVILLALAVVLAITAAMNRAKKNNTKAAARNNLPRSSSRPSRRSRRDTDPSNPRPTPMPEMKLPVSAESSRRSTAWTCRSFRRP